MMNSVIVLLVLIVCDKVGPQCYVDSDIAIHWSKLPNNSPFQEDSNQCLANYTIFNENHIDEQASKGVNCSRRDSSSNSGTWTYNGSVVTCGGMTGNVRCARTPGSVTLYTEFQNSPWPNGVYTCCIEGLCISIRVYQDNDFQALLPNITNAVIEKCSIIPPSDVTIIPQQYIVQMVTSGVPPIRLVSSIDCTNNGTTRGESYYSLIDHSEERYQYSVPVTWSADTNNTNHQYKCRGVFGHGDGGTVLPTMLTTSVTASSTPTINDDYEVINATAIMIQWNISGVVNGFIIKITSSGLSTVMQQLTNGLAREFVHNGLLPERNYTIEVRGYYELLGPAGTITVRLEAGISTVNSSLVSVSDDLRTQQIQVNCYTFRVEPYQVAWRINSILITIGSSYQPVNGSELVDSVEITHRHYIMLKGVFSTGTIISCTATVNGDSHNQDYELQAASSFPTGLSATIMSSSSFSVNWTPSSDVNGYIIQYIPDGRKPKLLNGEDVSSVVLENLTLGMTYQINVYSHKDLPSASSNQVLFLLDVPMIISFHAQPLTPSSAMVSWNISNSVIDNYTVSFTRLCDNVKESIILITTNSTNSTTTLNNLYPGLQYSVSITPVNILGKGIERTDNVTLEGSGSPTGAPLLRPPVVINSTAVRLSWEEVNCTKRNRIITGYIIQYNIEGGPKFTVNVTGVSSAMISGLAQLHFYYISVAAININGIGPYSQEFNFYTNVESAQCDCTGLLAGTVSVSVLSMILLVLLVVQTMWILYRMRRNSQQDLDEGKMNLYESADSAGVYDDPNNKKRETLVDKIKMQPCEVYGLNKTTHDTSTSDIIYQ